MIGTTTLGRTGIRVSRLGLGAAPLGGVMGPVSDAEAEALMAEVAKTPDVLIDTAPFYGMGLSERRVGRALAQLPPGTGVVSTKVGRLIRDGAYVEDYSYDGAMRSFEDSFERLGGRVIDIAHVHDPDNHFAAAMNGAFRALRHLKETGAIRAVSAGMNQWQMLGQFIDAGVVDCVLLAGRITLLDQSAEAGGFLAKCASTGTGLVAGGVFNSGILADPDRTPRFDYAPASPEILTRARQINALCASHNVPLRAGAIQYPLRHSAVDAVILGVADRVEWIDNIAMAEIRIPDGLWNDLVERQAC
jgi:D-threo-aldose 1-dehydrogenase